MTRTAALSAAALVAFAGFVPAVAHAQKAPPSTVVRYADLNLNRAEDAAILMKRVQSATAAVCREVTADIASLDGFVAYNRCIEETKTNTLRNFDAATIAALQRSQAQATLMARR